jgi:putative oxidoreductase
MNRLREPAHGLGLLLIRAMVGVVFVFHGSQKLFGAFGGPGIEGFTGFLTQLEVPYPALNAYLAAIAEFGGGLALILGAGTRLVAVPLVITMLVASFSAHRGAFALPSGMEYSLSLAVISAGLGLTGAGRWAVDAWIFKKALPPTNASKIEPRRVAA